MPLYGYNEIVQLAHANQGVATVQAYLGDEEFLLLRAAPGIKASGRQFQLWIPDFMVPKTQIFTAYASLHEFSLSTSGNWEDAQLAEYMQGVCACIATDLDCLISGNIL